MKCKNCGHDVPNGANYCDNCGKHIEPRKTLGEWLEDKYVKSWTIIGIIFLFLVLIGGGCS